MDFDIEFLKPPNSTGNIKATIHISGKIGFSQSAIEEMGIDENSYIKIGVNKKDKGDVNLYVMVLNKQEEETLKVNKAGNYYYVNTKSLFDKLGIDYQKRKIIYDIIEFDYGGTNIFKFLRREKDRKKVK